jgi:UDP-N-acetyl-D-glucosamine/UDP-N-acetyl-D-galactosamine dehydrogenase
VNLNDTRIAIIGLGYVGLPLAVEFAKHYQTIGFDICESRIDELKSGRDKTHEVDEDELRQAARLHFTTHAEEMRSANVYIVTVPTPIDRHKQPDFIPLIRASETVGPLLGEGDMVIYESTVYPGATEEVCVPVLEKTSGLKCLSDTMSRTDVNQPAGHFHVGYSPERINPGDKKHRVTSIRKVTAGSTPAAADFVDALYASIITAGTHKVGSIRVAEAAKVIENTQRDINIALVNELAIIFNRLGIDTEDVLEAAGTKWNFLAFRPGLVGGHCIGVDPYYLMHKALEVGVYPEMILSGRRINDRMGRYVAERVARLMLQRRQHVVDANILVMGLTFKENCPDLRNTRVIDIVDELKQLHANVDVYDPWVNGEEVFDFYGFHPLDELEQGRYDAILLAVPHAQFIDMGVEKIRALGKPGHLLYDVKYLFTADQTDARL